MGVFLWARYPCSVEWIDLLGARCAPKSESCICQEAPPSTPSVRTHGPPAGQCLQGCVGDMRCTHMYMHDKVRVLLARRVQPHDDWATHGGRVGKEACTQRRACTTSASPGGWSATQGLSPRSTLPEEGAQPFLSEQPHAGVVGCMTPVWSGSRWQGDNWRTWGRDDGSSVPFMTLSQHAPPVVHYSHSAATPHLGAQALEPIRIAWRRRTIRPRIAASPPVSIVELLPRPACAPGPRALLPKGTANLRSHDLQRA